jgi:two-component system cell cycle sensor histidine kinase PleC
MLSETYGPLGNPKYAEYQGDIHTAAAHLLNIVNEVLDIAKIEAGELTLRIDPVEPLDITRFAAKLISQRALTKGLTFDTDIDPALKDVTIRTDEVRLKQALINVLTNAVKFTEMGGSVKLSAGIRDGVFFEVTDTGVGMTPDELERALLPFVQVGRSLVSQEGSGLGLPLSRQLTERLGGRFEITSTVGVGTTVTITMPNG